MRKRKYDAMTSYLLENGGDQVTLTFTQLDELLFPYSGLPKTARITEDWWANDYKYPEKGAYGWLNADYEVIVINLRKEYIVFQKIAEENIFYPT